MTNATPSVLYAPANDAFLSHLLVEGRKNDLFYGAQFLSDHLPMALTSLRRLGASDEQLRAFQSSYSARLESVRFRDEPLKGDPWELSRGKIHHYPGLCRWFDQELKTRGRDAVLNEWIPRLIDAAGVDAFHALIRTALAVESGVDTELSAGLAYWVGSWKSLPVEDGPRLSLSARDAFDRLRADTRLGAPLTGMFGSQLGQLFEDPQFRQLIRWRGPNMGFAELAREAAQIYLACGHFFALHMVTGTQAVHCLLPWVGDPDKAADALWMSLAAAFLIIRQPSHGEFQDRGESLPPRNEVLVAALAHPDEHIAKLAYSAYREYEAWGHPEHRVILARIVAGQADLNFG